MGKIIVWADNVLSLLAKVLVGILASGVIVSVLLRYVFSIAFVWSEEILTMVFVATTFFGAALGLREREHIAITHFTDHASKRIQTVLAILVDVVVLVVCAYVFYYSIRLIDKVGAVPSPATGITKGVYYTIMPISFLLTALYAVVDILGRFVPIPPPKKGYKDDADLLSEISGQEGV